ncbi:uncharacterized protein TM35_000411780 [Trypanosoma theileri]|uniref:EF-hand domain-containing protein n=1 Tax=Trypanosoma theileri TaxID=67003 RepID=A0A1X0NJX3_9TRYP|nr:uncharacterized protein TM35_000411780 [Trypanosoma theileri]ORC84808.1 hypothetical protein TM35_000411780 [Trypanosoma theileri]
MSESGSIMFFEQSDHGSAKSAVPPSSHSHKEAMKTSKPVLNRPPLHQSTRRDMQHPAVPSPKRHRSNGTSNVVAAEHDDAASDYSESIQFHTEGASRNLSLASMPALPPVKYPPLNTVQNESKRDSCDSSRRQSDYPKIEGADESINFHVEGANSSQQQDVMEQAGISRNDSIMFHVVDDPLSEDPANKVSTKEDKPFATPKDTYGHHVDSSASTIVFETVEKSEAREEEEEEKKGEAPVVSDAAKLDSVPHTSTQAPVANPPLSSSVTGVSMKDKMEKRPSSRRKTLPPPKAQGLSSTGEKNELVKATSMPVLIGSSKGKNIPSSGTQSATERNETIPTTPPSSKGKVKSNSVKTKGKSEETLQANAKVETKTHFHVTVPPSVSSDGVKPPVRKSSIGNGKEEQKKLQPETKDEMESSFHSGESSPHAAGVAPVPYPSTMNGPSVPSLFSLEDGIIQAKMYTEHWRMFNDIQREEIAALVRRIIEARKADTIPEVMEGVNRRQATEASTLSGFVDIFNRKGTPQDNNNRMSSTRNDIPMPSSRDVYPHKMRPQPVLRTSSSQNLSSPTHIMREKKKRSISLKKDMQASRRNNVDKGVFSFGDKSSQWNTAAAKMAQSLSIVWPPKSKDALFFITGSRLTQQQCEEFYEAVILQASSSERVHAEVERATKEVDAIEEKKKRNPMRKKPVPTRTTILRKAFNLIDVDQKGVILATDIPAMRRLLEGERQRIEEIANGGEASKTVLGRARNEQRILKGNIDARRPLERIKEDAAFSSSSSSSSSTAAIVSESLLYAFVLDVILPLLTASGFLEFDFTTLGLLVFGSVSLGGINTNPELIKWREAALKFFEALA